MSLQTVLSGIVKQLKKHDKAIEDNKRLTINAPFAAGKASLQTIAAGTISVTRPHVVVLPESGTADNLDEIENFTDGKFIVISTADVGDTITVRDESVSGGNIALRGVTSRVLSDPEDSLLLIYKESVGFWIQAGGTPSGGTPALHASTHQHGGTDEVATATPGANAIPKAGGGGTLALGWIPAGGTPGAHAASHQNGGSDELLHQTLDGAGTNTHGNIDSHIANTSNPHSVTKAQVGLGNVTDDAQIPLTQKGAANGVAELDASSRLPVAQLPVSVMEYKGTWDASTNTPTLADGTGSAGDVYRVSVAGTQNLGSGAITFGVGDYIIYNGSAWEKSDTTDSVVSVNGATGVVVLTTDNIAEGVAADRNYITDAEQTKLAGIEALADVTDMANVGAAIVAASDGGAPQDTDEVAVNRAGTLTTLLWTGLKTAFNALYGRLGTANTWTANNTFTTILANIVQAAATTLTFQGAAGEFGAKVLVAGGFTRFTNSGKGDVFYETVAVAAIAVQLQITRPTATTVVRGFWATVNMVGRIGTVAHAGSCRFWVQGRNNGTVQTGMGASNINITTTIVTQTTTDITLKFAVDGAAGTWTEFSASIVADSPAHTSWTFTGSQVA